MQGNDVIKLYTHKKTGMCVEAKDIWSAYSQVRAVFRDLPGMYPNDFEIREIEVKKRVNVVTWVDCDVLTRKMGDLQGELVSFASHGEGKLGGDRGALVAAIELRDKLVAVIEKSAAANG